MNNVRVEFSSQRSRNHVDCTSLVDNLEALREFMFRNAVSFNCQVVRGNVPRRLCTTRTRRDLQNVHNVMCKY